MPHFDHFSYVSPIYDRLFRRAEASPLEALLGLPIKGRLLDAAGGTGRISASLVASAEHVTIADESFGMLRQTRSKPGLQVVEARIESLPFPSGCFERVIMVDAYHHLADQPRALQEMWRTLASDGRLIIEEPDIASLAVRLVAVGERLLLMRSHFRSAEHIASAVERLGGEAHVLLQEHSFWVIGTKAAGQEAGGGLRSR